MEEILSDVSSRVQKLEQKKADTKTVVEASGEEWVYFEEPHELVNRSVTSSDSSWVNSGSAKYVPSDAKRVILFAYVDGTADGTGLNALTTRSRGVTRKILTANEEGSGSAPAPCNEAQIPVSGGRFDYKATRNGGSGSFSFVIELVGYVR